MDMPIMGHVSSGSEAYNIDLFKNDQGSKANDTQMMDGDATKPKGKQQSAESGSNGSSGSSGSGSSDEDDESDGDSEMVDENDKREHIEVPATVI